MKTQIVPDSATNSVRHKWQSWLGEARTRILLYYFGLMVGFVIIGLPLMKQYVFAQVDGRVREDLTAEVADFQQLLNGKLTANDLMTLQREVEGGRPGFTRRPRTRKEMETIFEIYFARRVPEDDTFLIGIIKGQFYKSSPRALPELFQPQKPLMERWQKTVQAKRSEPEVSDARLGSILYITEPVLVEGQAIGVLVVAHVTEGERREALTALTAVFQVIVVLLLAGLILAWWLSDKVLSPLRTLSMTAHRISDTNLTARIPVAGNGEIAELGRTFNEMMNRLESAFDTQRKFINDAGHELRTPITIVRGHLELMGDDPTERAETLDLVMDELDRMSRLVNDLILLAKSERLDFLQPEPVDLAILTEELLAKATALGDRGWKIEGVGQGSVILDRQRIIQAMMNLAQNAVQHTHQGDEIAIGSSINGREVRLWVRDRGEGIALEEQERVFLRFARAAKTRRKSDGSGLGLAIVKAIAEAHSGRVLLSSEPGKGAIFTLVFPRK